MISPRAAGPIDVARSVDTLVPMLAANLVGLAASSTRIPRFGRRPHQIAYAICLAAAARRVLDDRARHADAIGQLALLVTLAGTRGGSRSHHVIALVATAAAAQTSARRCRRTTPARQAPENSS